MSCHGKRTLTMAEKLPGEMTVHVFDALRDNRVWSYRALWIGRWVGEEAPVTLALSPAAVTPLEKMK